MDAKKTIAKLKGEADRASITLYLSQSTYQDFKAVCGDISPSRVLEELMKEFVQDAKGRKPKKKAVKKN
jgi:hypothetical protein